MAEWLPLITDGNLQVVKAKLAFEDVKVLLNHAISAVSRPEAIEHFKSIRSNPDFDPVRKAHKAELYYAKIYLAEMKPLGFKHGVDCKKALHQVHTSRQLDGYLSKEEGEEIEALEKKLGEAQKVSEMTDAEANPPSAAPAS